MCDMSIMTDNYMTIPTPKGLDSHTAVVLITAVWVQNPYLNFSVVLSFWSELPL